MLINKCLAIYIGQGPDKLFEPFSVTKNYLNHSFDFFYKWCFTFTMSLFWHIDFFNAMRKKCSFEVFKNTSFLWEDYVGRFCSFEIHFSKKWVFFSARMNELNHLLFWFKKESALFKFLSETTFKCGFQMFWTCLCRNTAFSVLQSLRKLSGRSFTMLV